MTWAHAGLCYDRYTRWFFLLCPQGEGEGGLKLCKCSFTVFFFPLVCHAVVSVSCRGPLSPHPVYVLALGWLSLYELWVMRCVCVCALSPGLDLHQCQSERWGATEGPFTLRSPPNLPNTEVYVKTCRKKVFVWTLKMTLSQNSHRFSHTTGNHAMYRILLFIPVTMQAIPADHLRSHLWLIFLAFALSSISLCWC